MNTTNNVALAGFQKFLDRPLLKLGESHAEVPFLRRWFGSLVLPVAAKNS